MSGNVEDQRLVGDADDRVVNHIFVSGLTLARIVRSQRVEDDIGQRLFDVIEELDAAVRELRNTALARVVADRDHARPDTSHVGSGVVAMADPLAEIHADIDVRRRLRRVEDAEVFAYAKRGHDFFRASDHMLWAHESDDLLLSARSGTPLARRVGEVFYAFESDVALYYEDIHAGATPTRSCDLSAMTGPSSRPSPRLLDDHIA